jgi:hypothetical protein
MDLSLIRTIDLLLMRDIAPFSTFIAERVSWSMKEAAKKAKA